MSESKFDWNLLKLLGISTLSGIFIKTIYDKIKNKYINDKNKNFENILNDIKNEISNLKTQNNLNNDYLNNLDFKSSDNDKGINFIDKKRKLTDYNLEDVYKICFTGGPCAGKTTIIANISDKLRELGYMVFCIPEASSMIFQAGGNLDLNDYTNEQAIKFQYHLLKLQIYLEDTLTDLAFTNSNKKKIILCDRGVMDGSAYLGEELWQQLLDEYSIDVTRLRDKRYDLILHLVSAADGAEKYFSHQNNQSRHESLDFAKKLDKKIQNAYMCHQAYCLIDNESQKSFQSKINKTINVVMKYIGIGDAYKFQNKYLLRDPNNLIIKILQESDNIKPIIFDLEDVIIFTKEEDNIQYYRKRKGANNFCNYIKCSKSLDYNNPIEIKRQIKRREYIEMKNLINKNKYIIVRKRINFIWEKKFFIIDQFNINNFNFSIIIEQTNDISINKGYPKIIDNNIYKNISDIKEYSAEYLSKNGIKNFNEEDKIELKKFNN